MFEFTPGFLLLIFEKCVDTFAPVSCVGLLPAMKIIMAVRRFVRIACELLLQVDQILVGCSCYGTCRFVKIILLMTAGVYCGSFVTRLR